MSRLQEGRTSRAAGRDTGAQRGTHGGAASDVTAVAEAAAVRVNAAAAVAAARAATVAAAATLASRDIEVRHQVLQLPSSGSCSANVHAKRRYGDDAVNTHADDDGVASEVHGRGVKKKRV